MSGPAIFCTVLGVAYLLAGCVCARNVWTEYDRPLSERLLWAVVAFVIGPIGAIIREVAL